MILVTGANNVIYINFFKNADNADMGTLELLNEASNSF
jgi:hypothetical protein